MKIKFFQLKQKLHVARVPPGYSTLLETFTTCPFTPSVKSSTLTEPTPTTMFAGELLKSAYKQNIESGFLYTETELTHVNKVLDSITWLIY